MTPKPHQLEEWIAALLGYGTWVAVGVTTLGMLLPNGTRILTAGIALFIALPMLRVSLMLIGFVKERDLRFALIAAAVLAIILTGLALGRNASS